MRDAFLVVLGAVLATAASAVTTFVQSRVARRVKMDELIAERKVDANAIAYREMKQVQTLLVFPLIEGVSESDVLLAHLKILAGFFKKTDEWLFSNRLFLPSNFPDHWVAVRSGVHEAQKAIEDNELERAKRLVETLRAEARAGIMEIYDEMDLEPLEVGDSEGRPRSKRGWLRGWRRA